MDFIDYKRTADRITIVVTDWTGRKIETFRLNARDKKACSKIFRHLKKEWGFEPEILPEENINEYVPTEEESEKDKKINWFGMSK